MPFHPTLYSFYTATAKSIYESKEKEEEFSNVSDGRQEVEQISLSVIKPQPDKSKKGETLSRNPVFERPIDPANALSLPTGNQIDKRRLGELCVQKSPIKIYSHKTGDKVALPLRDELYVRTLHFKERYSFSKQMEVFLETAENFILLGSFGVIFALVVLSVVLALTSPLSLGVALPIVAGVGAYCVLAIGTWQGIVSCLDYSVEKKRFSSRLDDVEKLLAKSNLPKIPQNLMIAPTEQQAGDDKVVDDHVKGINGYAASPSLFSNVKGDIAVNGSGEAIAETSFISISQAA